MIKAIKLREHTISRPVAYRFVFDDSGWNGWAILTINEDTGEIHIQSDYGNYQHRWTPAHTGRKGPQAMHDFFATGSTGYFVDKFSYGDQPDLKDVFDEERTKAGIRSRIVEARRGLDIERDDARELWDEVDEWCEFDCKLACPGELEEFLGEPWEFIETKPSARCVFLTETLIPFLQTWVRENVLERSAVTQLEGPGGPP